MNSEKIYIFIMCLITFYAIAKEREELGCYRISIARQCDDNNSVFLHGTKSTSKDTRKVLLSRMKSILSYHEKAGVWKRCFILGIILTMVAYSIVTAYTCGSHNWFIVHILFVTILYFFFNYINYHHMRNLKNNGMEILNRLDKNNINK